MKYGWSFYNIDENLGGFHVIYNTKTSAVIKIKNDNYYRINTLLKNDTINNFEDDDLALLIKQGFVIDSSVNEFSLIKERYLNNYYDKNKLNITILPVEYCNLTCPYCFIYNYGGFFINDVLKNNILAFIKRRILNRNLDKKFFARINWYGGEPLLGKDKIIEMMKEIQTFILEQNHSLAKGKIYLDSSIVTNGVLLTSDVFLDLLHCGVKNFQITFDGGKTFHDKTRRYKNGQGSFKTILNNLKEIIKLNLKEKFIFSIRINFMKNTLPSVYPLIDMLANIIGNDTRFTIYCRPVYNFKTARDTILEVASNIFSIDEGIKMQKELTEYIFKKTNSTNKMSLLDSLLPYSRQSWCFEDNDYSFIVGANGNVYKCDTLIGDSRFSIGTLKEDGIVLSNINSIWMKNIFELKEFKKCFLCKLLPICFGSCKRNKFENNYDCYISEELIRNNIHEYIGKGGV